MNSLETYNDISPQAKLDIANDILKECTWGNTTLTPQDIISLCENKEHCKIVFSKIFQSSRSMYEHLRLIKKEWIIEFINEQKISKFNEEYFTQRKDLLIYFFIDSTHKVKGLEWD